MKIQRKFSNG